MPNTPYITLLLSMLAIFMLVQQANAIYITPVFGGITTACTQTSPNFTSCPDGKPITVSFSASAPYAPIYGNFTAYPTNYTEETYPVNFYGHICTISSSSTVTCFVTLKPVSPFMGSGEMVKQVSIKFVSSNYPQVSFIDSFNMTIAYNSTPETAALVSLFNSENSSYTQMNNTYYKICKTYKICQANVSEPLAAIGVRLANSSAQIYKSYLDAAYFNLTIVNQSISLMSNNYSSFVSTSDLIISNDAKANYIISNATVVLNENLAHLSNCSFTNGTKYSAYVQNSLAAVSSYPALNTLSGSSGYVKLATNTSSKENTLVKQCSTSKALLPKLPTVKFSMPSGVTGYGIYIVIIAIVLFVIYLVFRFNEFRSDAKWLDAKIEAKKVSQAPPQPEKTQTTSGAGTGAETPPPTPPPEEPEKRTPTGSWFKSEEEKAEEKVSSLEDSFDEWLNDHLGRHEEFASKPPKGKDKK